MSGLFRLYIFAFFCVSHAASATSTLSGSLRAFSDTPSLPSGTSLTLSTTQYFSSQQNYFREGAAKQTPSVSLGIREEARFKKSIFWGGINIKDEYAAAENWNYVDVFEFYAKAKVNPGFEIVAGRKLEKWNEWESVWGLGLFQPRYTENRLEPQAAGLLGVFFNWTSENSRLTLAALPGYLPDFGPMSSVSENKFVSANPWFHPPASEFTFNDVNTPLSYSVVRPDSWSVINNPGFAAKYEYEVAHSMQRLSYAYKPIPQLLFGFPSREKFHVDFFSIEIAPRLRYHHILSWDGVTTLGGWRLGLSATHERPIDDGGPQDWTSQQVSPSWIYSLSASRALEEEGPSAARLTFGYLKVIGGDAPDRGELANKKTLFERRFQYREGYLVDVRKPFRGLFSRPLVTGARVLYDRVQNGAVLSLLSSLAFNANFSGYLNVDVLGLLGNRAEVEDGFLTTYRANDRVALGMTYVF